MKKMRKIFAVLLTLAMVLAMSIPTFAAGIGGTTTITVKHAQDATLKYAQVVVADQTNSVTGWKFVDGYASIFENAFNVTSEDEAIKKLIALGRLEINPNSNAASGNINNGVVDTVKLGEQLANALDNITLSGAEYKANSDAYQLTNAATAGLYVITASKPGYTYNPMMAYVAFDKSKTDGSLVPTEVEAKGAKNQIKKEIDKVKVEGQEVDDQNTSITTGDVISYTITQSYPYYPANATDRTFVIEDEITNATFNTNSLNVKANDTNLVNNTDYKVDFTNGKKMTITFVYDPAKAGKTVTVKYSVKVDNISNIDNAKVINGATARANGKYTVAKVESAAVTFTVKKVDAADKEMTGLKGAEFQLYIASAEGVKDAVELTLKDNSKVWALSLGDSQKKTTDDNGNATFKGLDADKTYYVLETKAPAGFSLNDKAIQLTGASVVMGETTTTGGGKDKNGTEYTEVTTPVSSVTNFTKEDYTDTKLSALPSTGGIGTTIFTIAGCLIMVTAAGLFFASRKRTNK